MNSTLNNTEAEIVSNHASLTAYALYHGAPAHACDIQPGNGTRYVVVVTSMARTSGHHSHIEADYVLSLPYFQTSYPTNITGWTTDDYAAEKWTRGNLADGAVIATYLNEIRRHLNAATAAEATDTVDG